MALMPRLARSALAISIALFREMAGLEGLPLRLPVDVLAGGCGVGVGVAGAAGAGGGEGAGGGAGVCGAGVDGTASVDCEDSFVACAICSSGAMAVASSGGSVATLATAASYAWRLRLVTFPLSAFK